MVAAPRARISERAGAPLTPTELPPARSRLSRFVRLRLLGPRVPEDDRPVQAGGRKRLAAGVEVDAPDTPLVAAEGEHRDAGIGVPERDGPVPARGGEPAAVRTERHALERAGRV